jgi:3-methyl-2-oxobutanoate hydroxymethyltransferase
MIRHAQAVRRGAPNAWLIGDMPYMTYQASDESAVLNAGRFMAEAACDGIKLEGGQEMCSRVRAIVNAGIPVMGRLGMRSTLNSYAWSVRTHRPYVWCSPGRG